MNIQHTYHICDAVSDAQRALAIVDTLVHFPILEEPSDEEMIFFHHYFSDEKLTRLWIKGVGAHPGGDHVGVVIAAQCGHTTVWDFRQFAGQRHIPLADDFLIRCRNFIQKQGNFERVRHAPHFRVQERLFTIGEMQQRELSFVSYRIQLGDTERNLSVNNKILSAWEVVRDRLRYTMSHTKIDQLMTGRLLYKIEHLFAPESYLQINRARIFYDNDRMLYVIELYARTSESPETTNAIILANGNNYMPYSDVELRELEISYPIKGKWRKYPHVTEIT